MGLWSGFGLGPDWLTIECIDPPRSPEVAALRAVLRSVPRTYRSQTAGHFSSGEPTTVARGKEGPSSRDASLPMSLETRIAGSENRLIDGLHAGGRNSASFIAARRSTTFSPSSAASWKPSGVRLALSPCRSCWVPGRRRRATYFSAAE